MSSLDFSKIRSHKGSQNNAFEELICQLARLSRPENAEVFIRKEGAGGDAGVECFWKLKDGSEHAWQAKYFFELKPNQWNQISHSVTVALNKHPNLKKYYICLPLDRTDQKKDNKKSMLDKWDQRVEEWNKIAELKNMNVEFKFWGAHEILNMLSTDDPHFSGRALYWFNTPILQIQKLRGIANQSKESLGDRFSQELNVDLPIAKSFDGIGLTPIWYQRFDSVAENWLESLQNLKDILNKEDFHLTKKRWSPIKEFTSKLEVLLKQITEENSLYENRNQLRNIVLNLIKNNKIEVDYQEIEAVKKINWYFNRFIDTTSELSKFLFSKDMKAFSIKSMLLSGDAGVGKSHLLCDITLNRLANNLPTLFLLGQHYEGGNPLKFISDSLDLNNQPYKNILGALDALGEAHSTRTLIIVDAINEVPHKHREDWKNHLINLITELGNYLHIAFVFSCRSTYLDYLLPQTKHSEENQNTKQLTVQIEHTGFSDPGHRTVYKYLDKQNIFAPSVPIMNSEFLNPLFLKICCEVLKARRENRFPIGSQQGVVKVFNAYVDTISKTINGRKQYRLNEKVILKALQAFALELFPNNLHGISISEAREIVQSVDPKPETGSLFDELVNEGILSEDIITNTPVIRFTYERFSDYFIANALIEKNINKNPKTLEKLINKLKYFFTRRFYKIFLKRSIL